MSSYFRISLFYLIATVTAFAAANEPTEAFDAGIEAYQNGQYKTAKAQFTAAVEVNETAAARHNLGLAQHKLEALAESIWQMERAQLLSPFNPDYSYKLETVRQELGLFASSPTWYAIASQALSTKTWLIIASVSFWLLLAALILPRLSGSKAGIRIKSLRSLTIAALLLSLPSIWINLRLLQSGTVISEEGASLHAAPASAAPESGTARPGERARILDQYNNFYEIKTEGLATGWISKDAFRPIAD